MGSGRVCRGGPSQRGGSALFSSPSPSSSPPTETASTSLTHTVNGSHKFEITGYSLSKGIGIGKYIPSDTFLVGGYSWAIYFYPDGKSQEDNAQYISLFIALASEGADVRALFELTLLDQSGKGRHKVHSHFDRALDSGPYMLKYKGSMWGYKRFIRRTALETSDYLKDDSLAFHCTVGVVRTHTESPRYYSISVPPSDIGWQLKELLESEVGSDIVFEVGDETFKAHKLVLAARSPVFKAQFFGLIGDPKMERVIIEDVEPPVFKAMLVYIYSDALLDIHELLGSVPQQTSSILIQHLLVVADRYDLDRLKLLCESKLCEELTSDTVAMTLALAEQHHCIQLKSVCLRYVSEHLGDVMRSDGFKYLEESNPSILSELLLKVSTVDQGSIPVGQKRTLNTFLALNPAEGLDFDATRVRRRT